MSSATKKRARRTAVALGSTALIAGVGVVMAAFTATTENTGNSISTGTVAISDNDSGGAMFSVTNAPPSVGISRCIRVTYGGTLPSTVKLYSDVAALSDDTEFTVGIDRGTLASPPVANAPCPQAMTGSTVVVAAGTELSTFPANFASGYLGKTAPNTWVQNDVVDYKITITPKDNTTANARTSARTINPFTFTWEAQNS